MTNVKEFYATEGFQNLGETVTKCQNKEPYEDCLTYEYLEAATRQCNCTPFNIMNLQDSTVEIFISTSHFKDLFLEYMLAKWIGMLQNVRD